MRLAALLLMAAAACTTTAGGGAYEAHMRVDLGVSARVVAVKTPAPKGDVHDKRKAGER
jgi:hypothetical protein